MGLEVEGISPKLLHLLGVLRHPPRVDSSSSHQDRSSLKASRVASLSLGRAGDGRRVPGKSSQVASQAPSGESFQQSTGPSRSRGSARGVYFTCGQYGHKAIQCPQYPHQMSSQRPDASKLTMGDVGRSYRVFAAVDDRQAEHQSTVMKTIGVLCGTPIFVLFDSSALDYFISSSIVERCRLVSTKQANRWQVELATSVRVFVDAFVPNCELDLGPFVTSVDLRFIPLGSYGVVLGMDCLSSHSTRVDYRLKIVEHVDDHGKRVGIIGVQQSISLRMFSAMQLRWCMRQGCHLFVVALEDVDEGESREIALDGHPILREYADVFPLDILGMPPKRDIDFLH